MDTNKVERRKEDRCPEPRCNGVSFKWVDNKGPRKACIICGKELVVREDEMHEFKEFAANFQ